MPEPQFKRIRYTALPWDTVLPRVMYFMDDSSLNAALLVNKAWYHAGIHELTRTSPLQSHPFSPFTKLLSFAARTLHAKSTVLRSRQGIEEQMHIVQMEARLLKQREAMSYTATHAALRRVSELIQREHNVLHSPIHLDAATLRDVLVRHSYAEPVIAEITFWLRWRREHFIPVGFADVCLSFGCTAPQCCMTRSRTEPYICTPSTLDQLECRIPSVLWPCILDYIPYSSLDTMHTLTMVSPHFRSHYMSQPLFGPILSHYRIERALIALEQKKHLAYGLHELMLAAYQYKTAYLTLQHTLSRSNLSLQHAMVREFFDEAALYAQTKDSQHLRMLVQLDRGLLQTFGVDARTLEQPCVTQLPPRAFFQSATVTSRRNFQLPVHHEAAQYDGQRHRFLMHTQRLALTDARRTLWTALRRVEAFELQMPQRVMHDIQSFYLLAPLSPIAKQLADPHHNSMVPYDALDTITLGLTTRLEHSLDEATIVDAVVDAVAEIRRLLANMLVTVLPSLYHGYVSDVAPPTCAMWHRIALKLSKETSRVSLALSVSADDGFRMVFEERHRMWWSRVKPLPLRVLLAPLHIIGLFPLAAASDVRIQDAEVWVVFDLKDPAVTVVRRDHAIAAHLLNLFNTTSHDVAAALHVHGMVTGRCAPCGHVLKHGQAIGAKCKARLEMV